MNLNCKASSVAPQTFKANLKKPKVLVKLGARNQGVPLDGNCFFQFHESDGEQKMVWTFLGVEANKNGYYLRKKKKEIESCIYLFHFVSNLGGATSCFRANEC